ncbi:MAG: tRNA 2-selenouridine(34) synthase MnmH [Rhodoferax sp.]|nr:tRNA 2-selenouridine(34) synthase MnmH [Rhodoferax sp.]
MSLQTLAATSVIGRLNEFDTLIDARSEDEYALDHLPDAVNWPTLNNAERIQIGTLYKQVNPFEARKRGAAVAARNIAAHIERAVIDKPNDWKPLCYCWRGGQRSGALALILSQIGFRVTLVEGGYKAFRAAVVQELARLSVSLTFKVVCGPTGSGKTRLLQALAAQGAQVLDLEALANHRSSVLGAIPGLEQPCQKRFDTLIWDGLRRMDPGQPVFIESESKKVGDLALPTALVEAMHASCCLKLTLPDDERVALLLEDYDYLVRNVDYFCDRLSVLTALKGKAVVQRWQELARAGLFAPVVKDLLVNHYDPAYLTSMERNFLHFATAKSIAPDGRSISAMTDLSQSLLAG